MVNEFPGGKLFDHLKVPMGFAWSTNFPSGSFLTKKHRLLVNEHTFGKFCFPKVPLLATGRPQSTENGQQASAAEGH